MYHSFLIHSSADGHLGCFHVLAIINSKAQFYSNSSIFFLLYRIDRIKPSRPMHLRMQTSSYTNGCHFNNRSCLIFYFNRISYFISIGIFCQIIRETENKGFFTFMHWRKKWQPTPVFLPGESQGQGSLVGCCLWGHTELDMTEST